MGAWIARTLTALAAAAAIANFAAPAGAQVGTTAVTTTPTTARVATGTDTLLTVRWRVAFRGATRVESREGRFKDAGGRTYGSAVREPLQATGSGRFELSETLRVPESAVRAVLAAGAGSGMRFERVFTVNVSSASLVGSLPLQPASAIQAVAVHPPGIGITPQSPVGLTLLWEASLLPGITGPAGSSLDLISPEGLFRSPDGRILGRVSAPLSKPVPPPAVADPVAGSTAVSERLVVPHPVLDAALETGSSWFVFQRTFSVGDDRVAGELRLDLGGRVAASFGIDRAELMFLDGTRFKTVPPGEEIQAAADITFRGSGALRGSWSLAGPTTTSGAAGFVRQTFVDEQLSFGRRALIRSPAIRAGEPGTYLLRFSISEPASLGSEALQVSFVVRAGAEATAVSLLQPPPLARLSSGLPFVWAPVPGTRNYLLEFFDVPIAEGREPAAGMVLPGGESRAGLSPAAERLLRPGRSYWWRVVALGPDGALLGQSPMREMLAP